MAKLNLRDEKNITHIEEFVYTQVREAWMPPVPFIVGKKYLIKTLTAIDLGRLIAITGNFITLDDASWIIKGKTLSDLLCSTNGITASERFRKPVHINVNSIVDATEWELALPKESIGTKNGQN